MAIIISKKGSQLAQVVNKSDFALERNLQEYIYDHPESCTSPKCEAADCRLLAPSKSHDVWSASPGEWWLGAADCVAKLAQWT